MKTVKASELDVPKYYGVWTGVGWARDENGRAVICRSPGPLLATCGSGEDDHVGEIPADGGPPEIIVEDSETFLQNKENEKQWRAKLEESVAKRGGRPMTREEYYGKPRVFADDPPKPPEPTPGSIRNWLGI